MNARSFSRGQCLALLTFFASLTSASAAPPDPAADNALFRSLTSEGVPVGPDVKIPLPAPLLADGLDATGQNRALAELADDTHPLSALLRKSVVAPFKLKISDAAAPGTAASGTAGTGTAETGRRVDLWFIVHADLDRIADADVLQREFEAETKSDGGAAGPQSHASLRGRFAETRNHPAHRRGAGWPVR